MFVLDFCNLCVGFPLFDNLNAVQLLRVILFDGRKRVGRGLRILSRVVGVVAVRSNIENFSTWMSDWPRIGAQGVLPEGLSAGFNTAALQIKFNLLRKGSCKSQHCIY